MTNKMKNMMIKTTPNSTPKNPRRARSMPPLVTLAVAIACAVAASMLSTPTAAAQTAADLFGADSLPEIHVTIDSDSLAWILDGENVENQRELPASVRIVVDGAVYERDPIGFRLRGNTSRYAAKKSFKVSFNSFKEGATLFGMEKLNINGSHNDPSMMRAKIAWDLAARMDITASRSIHARMYINGAYMGLYLIVEHIDEIFVADRFGSENGNLYKCLYPADLRDMGSNPESYKQEFYGRRIYELTGAVRDDTYEDLAGFIRFLHRATDGEFVEQIRDRFNVDGFLRVLAFETLVGHWDNYWFNKNNFYLYSNPLTGRFEFIPYDVDNTFGIWWDGINGERAVAWSLRDIYDWGYSVQDNSNDNRNRMLVRRILSVPEFRDIYSYYVQYFIDIAFSPQHLNNKLTLQMERLIPAATDDMYRTYDYGFTIDDFQTALNDARGGHVTEGILPYIRERAATASAQADWGNFPPIIRDASVDVRRSGDELRVTVESRALDAEAFTMRIVAKAAGDAQDGGPSGGMLAEMLDDGKGADRYPADGIFTGEFILPASEDGAEFYLMATDLNSLTRRYPHRTTRYLTASAAPASTPLAINEFMADNSGIVLDPFGEAEDWIELHNAGSEPVSLSGLYLSDKRDNQLKWGLPDSTLAPGAFMVIWADEDGSQGSAHANFKLSKGGEFIGLYRLDGSEIQVIDSLGFGPQQTDRSSGRVVDGTGDFAELSEPTPGAPNAAAVSVEGPDDRDRSLPDRLVLLPNYPNPFNPSTVIRFRTPTAGPHLLRIIDAAGREVWTETWRVSSPGDHSKPVQLEGRPSGVYLYRIQGPAGAVTGTMMLVR
jgi:spore coat protein H